MENSSQGPRTPFERAIDEASSLANIIDVVMPPGRVCSCCGGKHFGPFRVCDRCSSFGSDRA